MSLLKCLKLLPEPGKNSGNPQIRSSFPKAVKQSVCLPYTGTNAHYGPQLAECGRFGILLSM